jgi:competence protein ComEA
MSELPPRPNPPRRLTDRCSAWLHWFGAGRLVAAAVSVLIVVVGAYWLVRSPLPATEAGLPLASVPAGSAPDPTLQPPVPVSADPAESGRVVVHVAGAVIRPGVYELDPAARVDAAIEIAGGPSPGADLNGLNLAQPLSDGQRVYVPVAGEVDPAAVASGVPAGDSPTPAGPVDLNRADAAEFDTLPGVGPATAAAIVGDRDRNGPFASVDDLDRVPGIGPAKLDALRDLVTV